MRHLRFSINVLVLLLPLALLLAGGVVTVRRVFGYLNTDARLAGTISAEATRTLGREVRVGNVHISGNLWGLSAPNTVTLSDVSVAEATGVNSPMLLRADRVTVGYNALQVLSPKSPGLPLIDGLQIVHPQLRLYRDLQGSWNFAPLLKQLLSTKGTSTRSLTDRVVVENADVRYTDLSFPRPPGVLRLPFVTRLQNISGLALVRPDQSVSFDIKGTGQADVLRDFHAAGMVSNKPFSVSAHLIVNAVPLPVVALRTLPPIRGRVTSGVANVDISALYTLPDKAPLNRFLPTALLAHGIVQIADADANLPLLGAPVERLNGKIAFTMNAIQADVQMRYAGVGMQIAGNVRNIPTQRILQRWSEYDWREFSPFVSLRGTVQNVDIARLERLPYLAPQIAKLPANVRQQIQVLRLAPFNAEFQIAGTRENPTAALQTTLPTVRLQQAHIDNLRVSATLANRAINADVHALLGGGELAVRGNAAFIPLVYGKAGKSSVVFPYRLNDYAVSARGRGLQLSALQAFVPGKHTLSGKAQIDASMSGPDDGQSANPGAGGTCRREFRRRNAANAVCRRRNAGQQTGAEEPPAGR